MGVGGGEQGIGREFDRHSWAMGRAFDRFCCPRGRVIWFFLLAFGGNVLPRGGDLTQNISPGVGNLTTFLAKKSNPRPMPCPPPAGLTLKGASNYVLSLCSFHKNSYMSNIKEDFVGVKNCVKYTLFLKIITFFFFFFYLPSHYLQKYTIHYATYTTYNTVLYYILFFT